LLACAMKQQRVNWGCRTWGWCAVGYACAGRVVDRHTVRCWDTGGACGWVIHRGIGGLRGLAAVQWLLDSAHAAWGWCLGECPAGHPVERALAGPAQCSTAQHDTARHSTARRSSCVRAEPGRSLQLGAEHDGGTAGEDGVAQGDNAGCCAEPGRCCAPRCPQLLWQGDADGHTAGWIERGRAGVVRAQHLIAEPRHRPR
jgi:hypothetical protein